MKGLFLTLFAAIYLALYLGYCAIPQSVLNEDIYHYGIVRPAKTLINWLSPRDHVQGHHNGLTSPTANLAVVRGCDGAGVLFLLLAAVVALRARLRHTLVGIAGALAVVYGLNELRIVVLYFVASREAAWFTPVHVYFLPTLMVLAGSLYFALWASYPHDVEDAVPA